MNAPYLARLKAIQPNAQKPLPSLPSKPSKAPPDLTKAPFEPFEGSQGRHVFKNECRTVSAEPEEDDNAEWAGLCADSIPAIYADCWARLQVIHPAGASTCQWQQALDDAAHFLETWGAEAEADGWTAGELFDVPKPGKAGGLLWRLDGAAVEAFGPDYARLDDGRAIKRESIGGK